MTNITSSMDITLVTLQNCPSDLTVIHQIFDKAAELGIDIDMISLAPSQSAMSSLSFTMSDHDLPKLLTFSSHLHNELGVKTVISSSKIFGAAANAKTDIRMITTAETEISLLVPASDHETTVSAIEEVIA